MLDYDTMSEEQREVLWRVYKMLAKWGREAEEAPHNAVYEGMTDAERGVAVYKKWEQGELCPEEMTQLESRSCIIRVDRLIAEATLELEMVNNALWNTDHHPFLMERIQGSIWNKLTVTERRALAELAMTSHWGRDEVEQVKEIIETTEWFSRLKP